MTLCTEDVQACDQADSPAGGKEGVYTGARKFYRQVFTWKSFCLKKFLPGKVFTWKSFCLKFFLPGKVFTWNFFAWKRFCLEKFYLEKFLPGQVFAWKSFQRNQISYSGASSDLQPGAWSPSNNLKTAEN